MAVDHGHALCVRCVLAFEQPAGGQRHVECAEEPFARRAIDRAGALHVTSAVLDEVCPSGRAEPIRRADWTPGIVRYDSINASQYVATRSIGAYVGPISATSGCDVRVEPDVASDAVTAESTALRRQQQQGGGDRRSRATPRFVCHRRASIRREHPLKAGGAQRRKHAGRAPTAPTSRAQRQTRPRRATPLQRREESDRPDGECHRRQAMNSPILRQSSRSRITMSNC